MSEEIKYGGLIIKPEDRKKSITTKSTNEEFTVEVMLPLGRTKISSQLSYAIGGRDIKSLPEDDYTYMKMIVTLNNVLIKKPDSWTGAENCPSDDLLWELYNFYLKVESDFQESLKKNKGSGLDKK